MYHGRGHFHAVFHLARVLQQYQYRVVVAGHEFFREDVTDQGFEFYGLKTVPFALEFEPWVNKMEKRKNIFWHSLKDRWTGRLYKLRERELDDMITSVKPGHLLIDAWQSTDFVVLFRILQQRSIRTCFIQTMCSTRIEKGIPPLNSLVAPADAEGIRKRARRHFSKNLLLAIRQNLLYLGKSNAHILRRRMKLNRIPERFQLKDALFAPAIENVDELVLAPREFDFIPERLCNHRHYIGFMPSLNRMEKSTPAFRARFKKLTESGGGNMVLIYCSFGSVSYENDGAFISFLEKLGTVIRQNNWSCVVSYKRSGIPDTQPSENERMLFFDEVPQLEVLQKTSVFITHGGLNSVKESIYHLVPMLVYPVSDDVDHMGNAARVVYRGLGLSGNIITETPEMICEKIQALISEPRFRKNLSDFKAIDLSYLPERIPEILEKAKLSE